MFLRHPIRFLKLALTLPGVQDTLMGRLFSDAGFWQSLGDTFGYAINQNKEKLEEVLPGSPALLMEVTGRLKSKSGEISSIKLGSSMDFGTIAQQFGEQFLDIPPAIISTFLTANSEMFIGVIQGQLTDIPGIDQELLDNIFKTIAIADNLQVFVDLYKAINKDYTVKPEDLEKTLADLQVNDGMKQHFRKDPKALSEYLKTKALMGSVRKLQIPDDVRAYFVANIAQLEAIIWQVLNNDPTILGQTDSVMKILGSKETLDTILAREPKLVANLLEVLIRNPGNLISTYETLIEGEFGQVLRHLSNCEGLLGTVQDSLALKHIVATQLSEGLQGAGIMVTYELLDSCFHAVQKPEHLRVIASLYEVDNISFTGLIEMLKPIAPVIVEQPELFTSIIATSPLIVSAIVDVLAPDEKAKGVVTGPAIALLSEVEGQLSKVMGHLFTEGNFTTLETAVQEMTRGMEQEPKDLATLLEFFNIIDLKALDEYLTAEEGLQKFLTSLEGMLDKNPEFNEIMKECGLDKDSVLFANKQRLGVMLLEFATLCREDKEVMQRFMSGNWSYGDLWSEAGNILTFLYNHGDLLFSSFDTIKKLAPGYADTIATVEGVFAKIEGMRQAAAAGAGMVSGAVQSVASWVWGETFEGFFASAVQSQTQKADITKVLFANLKDETHQSIREKITAGDLSGNYSGVLISNVIIPDEVSFASSTFSSDTTFKNVTISVTVLKELLVCDGFTKVKFENVEVTGDIGTLSLAEKVKAQQIGLSLQSKEHMSQTGIDDEKLISDVAGVLTQGVWENLFGKHCQDSARIAEKPVIMERMIEVVAAMLDKAKKGTGIVSEQELSKIVKDRAFRQSILGAVEHKDLRGAAPEKFSKDTLSGKVWHECTGWTAMAWAKNTYHVQLKSSASQTMAFNLETWLEQSISAHKEQAVEAGITL